MRIDSLQSMRLREFFALPFHTLHQNWHTIMQELPDRIDRLHKTVLLVWKVGRESPQGSSLCVK